MHQDDETQPEQHTEEVVNSNGNIEPTVTSPDEDMTSNEAGTPQENIDTEYYVENGSIYDVQHPGSQEVTQMHVETKTYTPDHTNLVSKSKKRPLFIVAVALVVLINLGMAGASGFFYIKKPKAAASIQKTGSESTPATVDPSLKVAASTTAPAAVVVSSQHYKTKSGNLEFDYPTDWRIDANADDSTITINSAKFNYNDEAGKSYGGILEIDINKKELIGSGFPTVYNESVAIGDSLKITYKDPTKIQRKETYLTFAGYDANIGAGGEITGNVTYAKGEALNSKDLSKIDPVITMGVSVCPTGCQNFSSGPINTIIWQNTPMFQTAQKIIESLRFN